MILTFALAGLTAVACANRGMEALKDAPLSGNGGRGGAGAPSTTGRGGSSSSGSAGNSGGAGAIAAGSAAGGEAGSSAGRGGSAGSGSAASGGASGALAAAGTTGAGGVAGGAGTAADAGTNGPTCASRFGFEAGNLHGAHINTGNQTAFTAVSNSADAFCGAGALEIATTLTTTEDKGEVIIPFPGPEDVAGKTLSITFKATPAGTPAALAIVFLIPSYTIVATAVPLPATWTTKTMALPAGAEAGTSTVTGISIQLLGRGDTWSGTISVDEIDLK